MRKLYIDLVTDKKAIRLIQLIYFLADTSDLLTMEDVADSLGVTKKTLKSDLELLQEYSPVIDGFVQVKKETIIFNRDSTYTIEEVLSDIIDQQPLFTLLSALLDGEEYSIETWCERIWLSERTLRRYLPSLTEVLERYNLTLQLSPFLALVGEEANIRYLYFDYTSQRGWREEDIHLDTMVQKFYYEFQEAFLKKYQRVLTLDANRAKLWHHVILQRVNKQLYIPKKQDPTQKYPMTKRFDVFSEIYDQLMKKYFSIENLPYEEHIYAYITTLASVIYLPPEGEIYSINLTRKSNYENKYNAIFDFEGTIPLDPLKSEEMYHCVNSFLENISLLSRVTPLFQRNSFELNQYAKTEFPEIYQACLTKLKQVQLTHDAKLLYPEDVATNLSLLFSSYLIDTTIENNKKILLSISGEACYVQHLIALLKKRIPSNFDVVWVFNEKITEEYVKKEGINVIIYNHVMLVPLEGCLSIKVSQFPAIGELERLTKKLFEI